MEKASGYDEDNVNDRTFASDGPTERHDQAAKRMSELEEYRP